MHSLKERLHFVNKFDLSGFKIVETMGSGRYGTVFHAQKGDQHIAIKKFNYPNESIEAKKYIEREITCLYRCRKIDQKLVINLLGISFTDLDGSQLDYPYLITNFVKNGTLEMLLDQIKNKKIEFTLLQKILLLRGIAKGFEWMHSKNVVHRDIKPENILIDENYYPIIADFGTCRFIEEENYYSEDIDGEGTILGTKTYEAPEILTGNNLAKNMDKTDVFSYAMIMYTVLTDKKPYETLEKKISIKLIIDHLEKNSKRFDLPNIPSYYQYLFFLLWNQNPLERPSFSDIIEIFDSGIIMPDILQNDGDKNNYFNSISDIETLSRKKCFSKETIDKLYDKFENKDNNPKLASVVLLFKADFMNDPEAQTKIGRYYIENHIFDQDQILGFEYLKRAADQNYKEAKFHLGIAYKYCLGVTRTNKTDEMASTLIKEAYDMGYEPAKRYIDHENKKQQLRINENNNHEKMAKIAMLGSCSSGKTTFVNKLNDKYNFTITDSTSGIDTCDIICQNEKNEDFLVRIIDTSGTERYKSVIKLTLHDVNLAIIMFDLGDIESFVEVDEWITFLRDSNDDARIMLIGNKNDLPKLVTRNDACEKAEHYDAPYHEISAKYGDNIGAVYNDICQIISNMINYKEETKCDECIIKIGARTDNQNKGFFKWFKLKC